MDRDGDGLVGIQDASKVVSKYKKSLPIEVVQGLEGAFKKRVCKTLEYIHIIKLKELICLLRTRIGLTMKSFAR